MAQVKFPALKVLLELKFAEWQRAAQKHRMPSKRVLAEMVSNETGVEVTHSSLYEWQSGRTKPSPKGISALAKFLAPGNEAEQQALETAIREATGTPLRLVDPIDVAESNLRPLTIGVIQFPRFCEVDKNGQPKGFLDTLVKYFVSFASLERRNQAIFRPIEIDQIETLLCETGEIDVVLGLFVDPGRTLKLWFYHDLPILVPLNAVRAKPLPKPMDIQALRKEMMRPNNAESLTNVFPIIDEKELGGIYVQQFLGLRNVVGGKTRYKSVGYNLASFAKELVSLSGSTTNSLPICVLDEVSCCRVKKQVCDDIEVAAKPSKIIKQNVQLVFGSQEPGPKNASEKYLLPRYRYGLAIARQHSRWIRYFADSFELFLESNAGLVSHLYKKLYEDLEIDLPQETKERIYSWLFPSENDRRVSRTWDTILKRTNLYPKSDSK